MWQNTYFQKIDFFTFRRKIHISEMLPGSFVVKIYKIGSVRVDRVSLLGGEVIAIKTLNVL